jgi:hypothetical protein
MLLIVPLRFLHRDLRHSRLRIERHRIALIFEPEQASDLLQAVCHFPGDSGAAASTSSMAANALRRSSMRRRLGDMLAVLIAPLAQEIQEQHGALSCIDHVFDGIGDEPDMAPPGITVFSAMTSDP